MSSNRRSFQSAQRQPKPRQPTEVQTYTEVVRSLRDWWSDHNIMITAFEMTPFPDTHGQRWTATVEVGSEHPRLSPIGCALVVVGLHFPGVYNPKAWELRNRRNPTFEVSWWTNDPE